MEARRSYRPPPSAEETSERAALVVRRGLPREDRDLFARAESTPAPGHAGLGSQAPKTGERAENSVLFSLDVLRAQASQSSPPPSLRAAPPAFHAAVGAGDDGTGTIDLKAMAAATGGSLSYKPLTLSEPPMAAFASVAAPPVAASSRPQLWMIGAAAGAAVALLGGVAVAATTLTGGHGAHAAAQTQAQIARAEGHSESLTTPRAAMRSEEPVSTHSAPHASFVGGKSSYRPSSNASTSTSRAVSGPKPAAAKSGGDRCNCHGVLACVIRCSATGK
jgi:hypothetical protein